MHKANHINVKENLKVKVCRNFGSNLQIYQFSSLKILENYLCSKLKKNLHLLKTNILRYHHFSKFQPKIEEIITF